MEAIDRHAKVCKTKEVKIDCCEFLQEAKVVTWETKHDCFEYLKEQIKNPKPREEREKDCGMQPFMQTDIQMDENYDTENPVPSISFDGDEQSELIEMLLGFERNLEMPFNLTSRKVLMQMAKSVKKEM